MHSNLARHDTHTHYQQCQSTEGDTSLTSASENYLFKYDLLLN